MASEARRNFDKNCEDVRRLMTIHSSIAGGTPGRKYGVDVLNKSAIVLITAFWEAYCEDLAAEALAHLVANCEDASDLPKELKKRVLDELVGQAHELAPWELAGEGWRTVLTDRLERLQAQRNRRLNTPRAVQIDELFVTTLGISKVSKSWYWPGVSSEMARRKLDRYVELRGSIAHRGSTTGSVTKYRVNDYLSLVKSLVGKTGGRVNGHLKSTTGEGLF